MFRLPGTGEPGDERRWGRVVLVFSAGLCIATLALVWLAYVVTRQWIHDAELLSAGDQAEALAPRDVEAHSGQGCEPAEVLRDVLYLEERVHFLMSPTMPSGAATTKNTSSTPTTSTLISFEMVTVTIC